MKWIFVNSKDFLYIDYLLNPLPLAVIALMGINDHYLKYKFPGWMTGKLSDFCGVFYFPLFIVATYTLVFNLIKYKEIKTNRRLPFYISQNSLLIAIFLTLSLMTLVKLSIGANQLIVDIFSVYFFEIKIAQDPMDLFSFLVSPLTYIYGKKFLKTAV